MTAVLTEPDSDPLANWAHHRPSRTTRSGTRVGLPRVGGGSSSRAWQRDAARDLINGHGSIVPEFFDVGCSRRRPWQGRPNR